jgi:hypothetical protein
MTDDIGAKVAHVKSARQTRDHVCHWPGCGKQVKPAQWGCFSCWKKIPKDLQREIWRTYNIAQEVRGTPSAAYIQAARDVQDWIAQQAVDKKATPPDTQPTLF